MARIRKDWEDELRRFETAEPLAGFPALPDVAAGRYVDPAFYELEQKQFWTKTWLLAGHTDELPERGSYKLWRDAGPPILLVRGKDDTIRAFYNTCQHRGSSLVKDVQGQVNMLACQFHCWTYDLEGTLKFVPSEYEFPGLDKSKRGLVPVQCAQWGNLIFINRDPDAAPLLDYLGPLVEDFADIHLEKIKLFKKVSKDIACNWKVLIDAFQEIYHFQQVHPHTINLMLDNRRPSFALYKNGHSRLIVPKRTDTTIEAQVLDRGRAGADPAHELTREAARTYTVFPNIIAAVAEFQWPLMVYWPTGLNTSRLDIYYLAPEGHADPESEACQQVVAAFDYVTLEDIGAMCSVQESMESEAFRSIPLSSMERRIYQHHEEIDRVIGPDKVPEKYRITPLLKAFEENQMDRRN
jgi:phenylpropionate dioxygenase-like ring-hydroxylating dioxygenase large terminal subunit